MDAKPSDDAVPPPVPAAEERIFPAAAARRTLPWTTILGAVSGLVGVAALAAAAWVYADTRREITRLTTEVAQFRLSLELFNQQAGNAPASDGAALTELANRLAILEESWRSTPPAGSAPSPATAALPAPAAGTAEGDCLPTGTRFLVAAGDSYPVCGTGAAVEIAAVDAGFITLADATVIAQGGTFPLTGTGCMLGVVSAGPELGGYAEIRVTC